MTDRIGKGIILATADAASLARFHTLPTLASSSGFAWESDSSIVRVLSHNLSVGNMKWAETFPEKYIILIFKQI